MKLALLTLLGLASFTFAQGPTTAPAELGQPAESRVGEVTVYANSAVVTRRVAVPQGKGQIELLVAPLPAAADGGTLYAEAGEGLRVMNTRYRQRVSAEQNNARVAEIDAKLQSLREQSERITAELDKGGMITPKKSPLREQSERITAEQGVIREDHGLALVMGKLEHVRDRFALAMRSGKRGAR